MTRRQTAEVAIGMCQVLGQYMGSTSSAGAVLYEGVTVAWWVWMVTGRMWGFIPLNVAALVVSTFNLWRIT